MMRELLEYLVYQQTFAFEMSKKDRQKRIAFHTLPFNKTAQSWIITDISGSFVTDDNYARMSALATVKSILSHDQNFRNIVNRCYAEDC